MKNLDGRKEERIMKYIAKSRYEGIAIAEKTFEGYYEIVLNPGWVWDDETTTFFSYDVATLKQDQQRIKFDPESWEDLTGQNYEDVINGEETETMEEAETTKEGVKEMKNKAIEWLEEEMRIEERLKVELKYAMIDLDRAKRRLDKTQDPKILKYFKDELKEQQEYVDEIVIRMAERGIAPENESIG